MIFNSLLIANRGEIACRIIKTAKEMGIRSIAVYVDADKDALFVKEADESIRLDDGGYLDSKEIISAAKKSISAHQYFMKNPSLSGRGESIKYDRPQEIILKNN